MNSSSENSNTNPTEWVDQYGDYLYNYALSRVNNQATAYDLVQDTFLAALAALKSFEGRSSEKTWLVSILKRKIIDHYRKSQRNIEDNLLDKNFSGGKENGPFNTEGDAAGFWKADRMPQDWKKDAHRVLENEELSQILEKCIKGLPEKWAAVFTLRIMEELSSEEVCKELGITMSNLWVILHRAKLQLSECVEKNWIL